MEKTEPHSIIVAKGVTKTVTTQSGNLTILSEVSLEIKPGESVAVIGISGSGKSTLLGILAGLDIPSEGEVLLDGHILNELDEDGRAAIRANRVGFVFQSFQLLPTLTALENVMLPLEINGAEAADQRAVRLLERGGLGQRTGHYPSQRPGREQHGGSMARALCPEPVL
mgnify:CR=1 FL=1